jgi:hypothetical protein
MKQNVARLLGFIARLRGRKERCTLHQ